MNTLYQSTMNWNDFGDRGEAILSELRKTLLPEAANKFIALDVETGHYVLGDRSAEAVREFRERYPGTFAYIARVDGRPVVKFHNRMML